MDAVECFHDWGGIAAWLGLKWDTLDTRARLPPLRAAATWSAIPLLPRMRRGMQASTPSSCGQEILDAQRTAFAKACGGLAAVETWNGASFQLVTSLLGRGTLQRRWDNMH